LFGEPVPRPTFSRTSGFDEFPGVQRSGPDGREVWSLTTIVVPTTTSTGSPLSASLSTTCGWDPEGDRKTVGFGVGVHG
jgi:hypothetical protein